MSYGSSGGGPKGDPARDRDPDILNALAAVQASDDNLKAAQATQAAAQAAAQDTAKAAAARSAALADLLAKINLEYGTP